MTIPELIDQVLGAIRNQFYSDRDREFMRDYNALMKAISRYGYDCAQRGWEFSVSAILADLMKLLNEIKRTGADIKWLPTYLEGAVRRHIGQRAEELQAQARLSKPKVTKIMEGTKLAVVITPDNTEILAAVYRDLKKQNKERRAQLKPAKVKAKAVQESLL
jgi:hypothetical protein